MPGKHINITKDEITIKFPLTIEAFVFEEILVDSYKHSMSNKVNKIIFDLCDVIWCDIFELSLLSMWMLELKDKGKVVLINYSVDKIFRQFLKNYKFEYFLDNFGIEQLSSLKVSNSKFYNIKDNVAPFFPLTYFGKNGYEKFKDEVLNEHKFENIIEEIADTDIVKTGAIRNIVVKEIGDNNFIHGNGIFSNMIMTRRGLTSISDRATWSYYRHKNASEFERNFFLRLAGRPYLELVISDKGDGIYSTLIKDYFDDPVIKKKISSPTEIDIIKYAFLYHSTSRTTQQRIGPIYNYISGSSKEFPPATGLSRLKRVAQEYHGLIYVRSGASIVCYDYINDNTDHAPVVNTATKRFKKLAEFGGTQIKVLFPLDIPKEYSGEKYNVSVTGYDEKDSVTYTYLSLSGYFDLTTFKDYQKEADALFKLFQNIEKIIHDVDRFKHALLIDFKNQYVSSKIIHYIMLKALEREQHSSMVLGINLDSSFIAQINEVLKIQKEVFSYKRHLIDRPTVAFDENLDAVLLGGSEKDIRLTNALLNPIVIQDGDIRQFAQKHDHLFSYNISEKRYELRFSKMSIIKKCKKDIQNVIAKIINDDKSKIYHKNKKVLLPSKKYCQGYFEIYNLFADDSWKNQISDWFKYSIYELNPSLIISISSHCGKVVEEVIRGSRLTTQAIPKHINFRTPINTSDYIKLATMLDSNETIVMFTDVIGTTATVKNIIENIQLGNVIKIIALVDAIDKDENYIDYSRGRVIVESIVKQRFRYHHNLPKGWRYSEICDVDPDTHMLVVKTEGYEGALWKKIQIEQEQAGDETIEKHINKFFDDVVIPTDSVIEGHFSSGDKHMSYLFNLPIIFKGFIEEIAQVITENITEQLEKEEVEIAHVYYPEFNPGLGELARQINISFADCVATPIKYEEFISLYDQRDLRLESKSIIILDDAFVSGDTTLRLIDIAERRGAINAFIYIIIKRGSEYLGRRLEKINQYGGMNVYIRFLTDAEIPSYHINNCPICKYISELENVELQFGYDKGLIEHIRSEKDRLAVRPVKIVIEEKMKALSEGFSIDKKHKLYYRWKLELAKTNIGMRKDISSEIADPRYLMERTLIFFQVLNQAKYEFILDDNVKNRIFYESFTELIREKYLYYISKIDELTDVEFDAVISVVKLFAEDLFIDNLQYLLKNCLTQKSKFYSLIIQVITSRRAQEYPARIKNIFTEINKYRMQDNDVNETINKQIMHWQHMEKDIVTDRKERLGIYKELIGGMFHEIGHEKETIVYYCDQIEVNVDRLMKSWNILSEKIYITLPKLRLFQNGRMSTDLSRNINNITAGLHIHLNETNGLIMELNKIKYDTLLREIRDYNIANIKNNVLRIHDIIYNEENGVRVCLSEYRASIKTVLSIVYRQKMMLFEKKGIKFIRDFTDDSCVVFGEINDMITLFQNLFDNVCEHSGGSIFKIVLRLDYDNEYLIILAIDNGKGYNTPQKFGHGLENVRTIITALDGEFKVMNVDEWTVEDPYYQAVEKGFKAISLMKIPHLRGVKDA